MVEASPAPAFAKLDRDYANATDRSPRQTNAAMSMLRQSKSTGSKLMTQ
jgi:hypothetical protein